MTKINLFGKSTILLTDKHYTVGVNRLRRFLNGRLKSVRIMNGRRT